MFHSFHPFNNQNATNLTCGAKEYILAPMRLLELLILGSLGPIAAVVVGCCLDRWGGDGHPPRKKQRRPRRGRRNWLTRAHFVRLASVIRANARPHRSLAIKRVSVRPQIYPPSVSQAASLPDDAAGRRNGCSTLIHSTPHLGGPYAAAYL